MEKHYEVWGMYKRDKQGWKGPEWKSTELWVKDGEVRWIDGELHRLAYNFVFSRWWTKIYFPQPIKVEKK